VHKVLIANRGEIAVRIATACRAAGLASVAVYADPDRDAVHVRAADEAVALGGMTPAAAYGDAVAVLRAAVDSGADAVHPGYGFLAEDAEFAQLVLDTGLTWIGPGPAALRLLGDKRSARQLAARAGAPLLAALTTPAPGTAQVEAAQVGAFARAHGLPIVIKAVSGGGGRHVRVARTLAEIPARYADVLRSAATVDGRADCFAERFLDQARHLETQCLADRYGHVVVVSTRDGTVQRRHQKIVEEAPAPFLPAGLDTRLRKLSKQIVRAAGCTGAATCEFLLGRDGTLAFLETNPRLAVAHPVSEQITGLDLVRETFRLAAGEPLGYDDPPARGHALQFRIYAEDPGRGFAPSPGPVLGWRPPSGAGVRVDAGVGPGSVVVPAYGTLLAKLIVTGASRPEALRRARRALGQFEITGVATTLPFHRWLVEHKDFAAPDSGASSPMSTDWVDSAWPASGSSTPSAM
jgi:acetyl-CoA/propionyl-CoA carboxylase biotin carboxyl carrier protein